MSRNKKVKENLVLDFSSLPQRVIVHEILSAVVVNPSARTGRRDIYACFGYFKRDRLRNIWFVFPSIKVLDILSFFIRSSKLFYLHLEKPTDNEFRKIMEHRKNFVILEQIKIVGNYTYPHNIVSTEFDLPRVNKLTIFSNDSTLTCDKFHPKFLERLVTLKLNFQTPVRLDQLVLERSQNLRELILKNINFEGTNKHLKFPNLKTMVLSNISTENEFLIPSIRTLILKDLDRKLDIKTGKNLKIFDIEGLQDPLLPTVKNVVLHSPNLEEFKIILCPEEFYEWIFESEELKNKLKLKNILILLQTEAEGDYEIKKKIILETSHLEKLSLICSELIQDDFFSLDLKYPVLKELVFQCIHIPRVKENMLWVFSNHLEKLTLHTIVFENGDILFRRNRFTALKELRMHDVGGFFGKKYNPMPNLEELYLNQVDDFTDDFFKEQEFKKLRKLEINAIDTMNGRGYNKVFESLESLKIVYAPKLNDDFFIDNRFPVLKELEVKTCRFLTGEKWNTFKSLKKFKSIKCNLFGNEGFRDGVFAELEYLYISKEIGGSESQLGFNPRFTLFNFSVWEIPNLKIFAMGIDMENEFENGFIDWLKDTNGCEIRIDRRDIVDGEVFYYVGEPIDLFCQ